jgi:hypothetical protein
MGGGYSYVLSGAVSDFAFGLLRREQHRLAGVFRQIAAHPHRDGDYCTTDAT